MDLVLLIEQAKLNVSRLGKSISKIFQRRYTHSIPTALAPPPASAILAADSPGFQLRVPKPFQAASGGNCPPKSDLPI